MSPSVDVIDAHAHLQQPPYTSEPDEALARDLLTQMDFTSVDMAVIFPVAAHKGNPKNTAQYNDFIADMVKKYPQFVGFGSVNPLDGKKAVEELDRFPTLKLKGVKLHPSIQNFHCDSNEMHTIAQKCEELNLPILIHAYFPFDGTESQHLYKLVTTHESTQFILAHTGGHTFLDFYTYTERRKAGRDNVYFDVSSLPIMFMRSPYKEQVRWLLQQMGADRVVFGSNYPKYQLVDALAAFEELGLPFEESQKIMSTTISTLLNL